MNIEAQKRLRAIADAGAAAGRFTAEKSVTETFPELRKIVGLRNRSVHGYDSLDEELIWDVVQNHLPVLKHQVEALLEE